MNAFYEYWRQWLAHTGGASSASQSPAAKVVAVSRRASGLDKQANGVKRRLYTRASLSLLVPGPYCDGKSSS